MNESADSADRPQRLPRPQQIEALMPDQVVAVVMRLAMEIAVLRDRLRTHELLLEKSGTLSRGDIEDFRPDADEAAARTKSSMQLIEKILADLGPEAPR